MNKLENEIRRFLVYRALPIITEPESGDTVYLRSLIKDTTQFKKGVSFEEALVILEENADDYERIEKKRYDAFLDKVFSHITIWDKRIEHCACVGEIIKRKKMTLLQFIVFVVKHDIDLTECTGMYDGTHNLEESCYFQLDRENQIDIDFRTREDVMESNTQLRSIIRGAFDYLKGRYCKKHYAKRDRFVPSWISFNDKYWYLQAELFYKGLPPLSNKGCHGRKVGITLNEECKDCKFFAFLKSFHHCDFDYWEKYGEHNYVLLPDDGRTYACKHFVKTVTKEKPMKIINGTEISKEDLANIRTYSDISDLACRDCLERFDKKQQS